MGGLGAQMFGNGRSGTDVRRGDYKQMFDGLGSERMFGAARGRLYHMGSLPVKGAD